MSQLFYAKIFFFFLNSAIIILLIIYKKNLINLTDFLFKTNNYNLTNESFFNQIKHNLAIVQTTDDLNDETTIKSIENKRAYAKKHNYTLIIYEPLDKIRHAHMKWAKLLSVLKAFDGGYEWVWMLDTDTLITNPDIQIHLLADFAKANDYHIVISKDCNEMNTGSVLFRNTKQANTFIKRAWNTYGKEQSPRDLLCCDNRAFLLIYYKYYQNKNFVLKVPQISINSYPIEQFCKPPERPWESGDFLIHFAGCDKKDTLFKKYLNLSLNLDTKLNNLTTQNWIKNIENHHKKTIGIKSPKILFKDLRSWNFRYF